MAVVGVVYSMRWSLVYSMQCITAEIYREHQNIHLRRSISYICCKLFPPPASPPRLAGLWCGPLPPFPLQAIVNPDWQDMLVLVQYGTESRSLSAVYRKPMEGGSVPVQDRHITAHVEADRHHIQTVINFCCSFMWASILDSAPPLPQLNLL